MKREDFTKFCRYYKGENQKPDHISKSGKGQLWEYERCWVDMIGSDEKTVGLHIDEYINDARLEDFQEDDGCPLSLKSFLFNRYRQWNGYGVEEDAKGFKSWYMQNYIGQTT